MIGANQMVRTIQMLVVCVVASAATVERLNAATIQYSFSGVVTNVDAGISGVVIGDDLIGTITLDTSVADAQPGNPENGVYYNSVPSISLSVGSFSATGAIGGTQYYIIDNDTYGHDGVRLWKDVLANEIGGRSPDLFHVQLLDTTQTSFDDDSANKVLSITDFNDTYWSLAFPKDGGGSDYVTGSFSSFSAAPVPEPSSLALLGIGICLTGVGVASRRHREKRTNAAA